MKKAIKRISYVFILVLIFGNISAFAIDKEQIITSSNAPYTDENTGYLPRPVEIRETDKPVLTFSPFLRLYGEPVIDATYDLRDLGIVSDVRSQGSSSVCWTFGALSSLESTMLKNNIDNKYDYSESHMKHALSTTNTYGFDRNANGSGNFQMASAYLARGSGPVLEKNDVFVATDTNRNTSITDSKTVEKYATKMYQLPNLDYLSVIEKKTIDGKVVDVEVDYKVNYSDEEREQQIINTKKLIMDYGVAFCSYYSSSSAAYNSANASYYYYPTTSTIRPNHAVSIVGWDDTYDKSKFNSQPPGNGAFLIKNSWGTSWGNQGYFWMSYYDKYVAHDIACIAEVKNVKENDNIYQYDQLGATACFAYDYTSIVGANKFTASQPGEILKAVAFYTAETNLDYKIYVNVIDNQINDSTLIEVASGTLEHAGYHTIDIPEQIISGTSFAVAIKLINLGTISPTIQLEIPYTGYSSKATSNANEGFVFLDILPAGYEDYWDDTSVDDPNSTDDIFGASVCIKAFTDKPTSSVSFYNGNDEVITGTTENDTVVSNIKVRDADQNTKAVLATYKDNKLENISYQPVSNNSINVFNSVFPSGSGYTFKSMLINENTLKPLIKNGYTITK